MISVIIPVYNGEKWIRRCMNSIVNQTVFGELEVIVVDDGSVDGTVKILREEYGGYSNIKVYSKENGGVSSARNYGMDRINGEYIAYVDVDDYIDDDYFEELIDACTCGTDMVISGYVAEYDTVTHKHCIESLQEMDNKMVIKAFVEGNCVDPNIWNKLFRRDIVGDIRFDNTVCIAEDKLFLYECLKKVKKVVIVPNAKYHYILNSESAMRKGFSKKKLDSLIVTEKIICDLRNHYCEFADLAESMNIDVKCRVFAELYEASDNKDYEEVYKKLQKDIKSYSIVKKIRFSTKKHLFAFLAMRISPKLYLYLRNDMKLQYK